MMGAVLICSNESYFDDDLIRDCSRCGTRVYIRPHSDAIKIKVCAECGNFMLKENEGIEFAILPETVKEIRRVLQLGGIFRERGR